MNATRLLVSVRSAEEARIALAGGADIIDVKEPSRGSLGMADSAMIQGIVNLVAGRVPVSVALGERLENPLIPDLTGITWAKIGLGKLLHYRRNYMYPLPWFNLEGAVLPARLLYAVYADHKRVQAPSFDFIMKWMGKVPATSSFPPGILIDTTIKDGKGLLYWYDVKTLRQYRQSCHRADIFLALAGSLTKEDIKLLLHEVQPDIIAIRGAACEGNKREEKISEAAVAELKALIQVNSAK